MKQAQSPHSNLVSEANIKSVDCPYHGKNTGIKDCDLCCPKYRHDFGRRCGELWEEEI